MTSFQRSLPSPKAGKLWLIGLLSLLASLQTPAWAVDTKPFQASTAEFQLANGMRFILIERPDAAVTSAGWVVASGSASDPVGRTGLAHFMEHMLFQGSATIGTTDFKLERTLLQQEDEASALLLQARGTQQRSRSLVLEKELSDLRQRLDQLTCFGEFSALYAEAGGTGLDARTYEDVSLYFVELPAEKIELWFWLESDRLLRPVFRQLERERAVVAEERRQRIDSVPDGRFQERLQETLWSDTPYAWTSLGRAADLERLSRGDLERFFAAQYRPDNLTAILVGPHRVDSDSIKRLAERYFARLINTGTESSSLASPLPSLPPNPAEVRESGPGRPQLHFLYRTVPHGHDDTAALEVTAALLSGLGGRLYRRVVVEEGLATVAYAQHRPLRFGGSFAVVAEPSGTLAPLRRTLDTELQRLISEPISENELERVKNHLRADHYRRLKEPRALLLQQLIYAGLDDHRHLETWPPKLLAVSAADVQRVARQYLTAEKRLVGRYDRSSAGVGKTRP